MDPIQSIVVPTDFGPGSQAAAVRALRLALPYDASIHLVHAVRFPMIATPYYDVSIPDSVWDAVRSKARGEMESARKAIEQAGISTVGGEIHEFHDPAHVIAEVVEQRKPDLVAMATHGRRGIRHLTLGSVTERTLRRVRCPVLAVKEDLEHASSPIEKILLAVDFSAHSDRAVEATRQLAGRLGASVDVLHAFDVPADCLATLEARLARNIEGKAEQLLEEVRESLSDAGAPVAAHLRRGLASAVISEAAERLGPDLIVMGRRGLGGLSRLMIGSVAERTIRNAPCSVLTVQADAE